jgi:hypothetical protein
MNIEFKKIESLQHKEETNARIIKNDSSFLLFKHLGFRREGSHWKVTHLLHLTLSPNFHK